MFPSRALALLNGVGEKWMRHGIQTRMYDRMGFKAPSIPIYIHICTYFSTRLSRGSNMFTCTPGRQLWAWPTLLFLFHWRQVHSICIRAYVGQRNSTSRSPLRGVNISIKHVPSCGTRSLKETCKKKERRAECVLRNPTSPFTINSLCRYTHWRMHKRTKG